MCSDEVFGDWYPSCRHFVGHYLSGTRFDCMQPNCGLSSKHAHKALNCPCPKVSYEERRIQNIFRKSDTCPTCITLRTEEFDRRVGRKPNNEAQY